MKRTICAAVLAMGGLLASTHAFAIGSYTFQSGIPVEYELPPNEPQVFSNVFMWPVKASCKIISATPENTIAFRVLRKNGSVNDVKMSSGDQMTLVFYPNDVVHITAASGGKVELLNLGKNKISALCSTEG